MGGYVYLCVAMCSYVWLCAAMCAMVGYRWLWVVMVGYVCPVVTFGQRYTLKKLGAIPAFNAMSVSPHVLLIAPRKRLLVSLK